MFVYRIVSEQIRLTNIHRRLRSVLFIAVCSAIVTLNAQVSISVTGVTTMPVNRKLIGANMNDESAYPVIETPQLKELTKPLNLGLFRYPGGAVANTWDWKTGARVTKTVLEECGFPEGHVKKILGKIEKNESKSPFSVEAFNTFAQSMGGETVWVLNLLTGYPAMSASWLMYVREKNIPHGYWELGNEYYIKDTYGWRFPDIASYIDEAKKHVAAMRAVEPSVKIGIVGQNLKNLGAGVKVEGDATLWVDPGNGAVVWNATLAQHHFYDAVIIHDYLVPGELWKLSAEDAHSYLMARNPAHFAKMMVYYKKTFGNDVKLWVTEWNIHPIPYHSAIKKAGLDYMNFLVTKTLSHALYVADELMQMFRYSDTIELANIHVLAAPFFWGLFQADFPEKEHLKDPFVTNLPWHIFRSFALALEGCDSAAWIDIPNSPMMKGVLSYNDSTFPAVTALAFYKTEKPCSVLLLNKGKFAAEVSFDISLASASAFTGDEPLEDWGKKKSASNELAWKPKSRSEACTLLGNNITVPAYSFTTVMFQ